VTRIRDVPDEIHRRLAATPGHRARVELFGAGKSLFRTAPERLHLHLVEAWPFRSGSVLLTYRPAG
jgi:hypothetical protein